MNKKVVIYALKAFRARASKMFSDSRWQAEQDLKKNSKEYQQLLRDERRIASLKQKLQGQEMKRRAKAQAKVTGFKNREDFIEKVNALIFDVDTAITPAEYIACIKRAKKMGLNAPTR